MTHPIHYRTILAPDESVHIDRTNLPFTKEEIALDLQNLKMAQKVIFDTQVEDANIGKVASDLFSDYKEKCSIIERLLTWIGFETSLAKIQRVFASINPSPKIATQKDIAFINLLKDGKFGEAFKDTQDLQNDTLMEGARYLVDKRNYQEAEKVIRLLKPFELETFADELAISTIETEVDVLENLFMKGARGHILIFRLASSYITYNQSYKALDMYRRFLNANDRDLIKLGLICTALLNGSRYDMAIDLIAEWVLFPERIEPHNYSVIRMLARAFLAQSDIKGPITQLLQKMLPQTKDAIEEEAAKQILKKQETKLL